MLITKGATAINTPQFSFQLAILTAWRGEVREGAAIASLRLIGTVGLRRFAAIDRQDCRSLRRAPRTDGPLMCFVLPRGESSRTRKRGTASQFPLDQLPIFECTRKSGNGWQEGVKKCLGQPTAANGITDKQGLRNGRLWQSPIFSDLSADFFLVPGISRRAAREPL